MTDRPDVFVSYRHRTPHATWVRDVLVPSLRTDGYSVVLDVDTGVDDACALLLAALHPDLDLLAVSCVDGNAPLADVVRRAAEQAGDVLVALPAFDEELEQRALIPLQWHPRKPMQPGGWAMQPRGGGPIDPMAE